MRVRLCAARLALACVGAGLPCGADPVRVSVVGDLSLVDPIASEIRHGGDPFAAVRALLSGAALTFGNLECVLSNRPTPERRHDHHPTVSLRAPCEAAAALVGAGFDVVSMANNHAFDLRAEGARDSLGCVTAAGLHPVGMGDSPAAALAPYVAVVSGLRVGVLAFTYETNHPPQGPMRVALLADDPVARVRALRPTVDVVMVSLHWGVEFTERPRPEQVALAHALVDAGADVIVGHHPHVLQSVEVYRHRPILYSLGNFLFGPQPSPRDLSVVANVTLERGGSPVRAVTLVPVRATGRHGELSVETGADGDAVRERVQRASAAFHTALTERAGELDVGL